MCCFLQPNGLKDGPWTKPSPRCHRHARSPRCYLTDPPQKTPKKNMVFFSAWKKKQQKSNQLSNLKNPFPTTTFRPQILPICKQTNRTETTTSFRTGRTSIFQQPSSFHHFPSKQIRFSNHQAVSDLIEDDHELVIQPRHGAGQHVQGLARGARPLRLARCPGAQVLGRRCSQWQVWCLCWQTKQTNKVTNWTSYGTKLK